MQPADGQLLTPNMHSRSGAQPVIESGAGITAGRLGLQDHRERTLAQRMRHQREHTGFVIL
jgi:hypothetical protein